MGTTASAEKVNISDTHYISFFKFSPSEGTGIGPGIDVFCPHMFVL